MKSQRLILVIALCLVLLAAGVGFGARQHSLARRHNFDQRLNDASDEVAELIDKLDSDQNLFDQIDDRAVVSVHRLRDAAWTDRQRQGVDKLADEIGMLRACRAARNLPGDDLQNCLDETQRLNDAAFERLER